MMLNRNHLNLVRLDSTLMAWLALMALLFVETLLETIREIELKAFTNFLATILIQLQSS